MIGVVEVWDPMWNKMFILMPFSTDNREFLKDACGKGSHVRWEAPYWRVSGAHLLKVQKALADRYGMVTVHKQGAAQTTCADKCWNASLDSIDDCVCGCAGANHGSGKPFDFVAPTGEWSAQTEYTTWTYEVTS